MTAPAWLPTDEICDEDMLKAVRTAIAKILAFGQEQTVRGNTYSKADLPDLREYEQELMRRIATRKGPSYNLAVRARAK